MTLKAERSPVIPGKPREGVFRCVFRGAAWSGQRGRPLHGRRVRPCALGHSAVVSGEALQMDPGTDVLKPLQDQVLTVPDRLPLSPAAGRHGVRGAAARAGRWHRGTSTPPRLAARVFGASILWLGWCREMRRGRASAPNIKSSAPRSLAPSASPCPAHPGFYVGLRLLFHLTLLESAAEEELGVQEARVHLPPSRQVLLCLGRRGADSLSRISVIPGTDPAPPACTDILGLVLGREDVDPIYSVG